MVSRSFRIPSVGVEEEYQLIDHKSGKLVHKSRKILKEVRKNSLSDIQHELHLEQIEMASPVLQTTDDVRRCVIETRRALNASARHFNARLVAAGTHPMHLDHGPHVTPDPRYQAMAERFQSIAQELMIFGCHVHVHMPDREIGVQVMNRLRPWIPVLQALTANSPFWNGHDTGYASIRRELWQQWPLAGIPHHFRDLAELNTCVEQLVHCELIDDPSKIYWDVRLPTKTPTIELRVADVITNSEDVVAYVALVRAMVMQAELETLDEISIQPARPELLRGSMWHAARYGLQESLVDPISSRQVAASELLARLLNWVKPAVEAIDELQLVQDYLDRASREGSPASYQRIQYRQRENSFKELVFHLADSTVNA